MTAPGTVHNDLLVKAEEAVADAKRVDVMDDRSLIATIASLQAVVEAFIAAVKRGELR